MIPSGPHTTAQTSLFNHPRPDWNTGYSNQMFDDLNSRGMNQRMVLAQLHLRMGSMVDMAMIAFQCLVETWT